MKHDIFVLWLSLFLFVELQIAVVIEKVEEQIQSIIVVDVSVADKIMGIETVQRTHVIDKIIYAFKLGSGVHGYQTLPGLDLLYLAVNGQGKVSGYWADDEQIVRLHAFKYG